MADLELYWVLLGPLFYAVAWWRLSENTNKPGWFGLLTLLPVVGIFAAYYMAVYEPKQMRY